VAWLTETVFASPVAVGSSMAVVGFCAFTMSALLAFRAASAIALEERI
jgi:hypothetical protein